MAAYRFPIDSHTLTKQEAVGTLWIVDLAGSERSHRAGSWQDRWADLGAVMYGCYDMGRALVSFLY